MTPQPADEPFFITEEVEACMIASGNEFEPPRIACTTRLSDVLGRMTDAALAWQPGELADQERERRQRQSSFPLSSVHCA